MLREVLVHRGFSFERIPVVRFIESIDDPRDRDRLYHRGPERANLSHGAVEYSAHLLVIVGRWIGVRVHRLAYDADSSAAQAVAHERIRIGPRGMSHGGRRDRIQRVVPNDDVEHQSRVSYRACDWTERIRTRPRRNHAVAADQG